MKEFIGRLTELDPAASETLKIVAYFDELVDRLAGLDAFVRGGAALTGCTAGIIDPEHRILMRCAPDGHRCPAPETGTDPAAGWPQQVLHAGSTASVWIERDGESGPNDAMVLERFAAGARITLQRTRGGDSGNDRAAVEVLLDPAGTADARRSAAHRLRIDEHDTIRVLATPPGRRDADLPARCSDIITVVGPVRAIVETKKSVSAATAAGQRIGIGPWTALHDVPDSWDLALTALRMTSRLRPTVSDEDAGPLVALAADAAADREPHPDVRNVASAAATHDWATDTLQALTTTDSVRAAATLLGVHHSTMQNRIEVLDSLLGYSVATMPGCTRAAIALALFQVSHNRFDYVDGPGIAPPLRIPPSAPKDEEQS